MTRAETAVHFRVSRRLELKFCVAARLSSKEHEYFEMIGIASDNVRKIQELQQGLGRDYVCIASSWKELVSCGALSDCCLIAIEQVNSGFFEQVRRWRQDHQNIPLVVQTVFAPENVTAVARLAPTELLWWSDSYARVRSAVETTCRLSPRSKMLHELENTPSIPREAKSILSAVLSSESPMRNVSELMPVLGRDRRTIWKRWSSHSNPIQMSLKELVDWGILLRGLVVRRASSSWDEAAIATRVTPRTMSRISRRLTGFGLRELAEHPDHEIFALLSTKLRTV